MSELLGVDLAECCRRIGISYRTAKRLIATGEFPIPELPPIGRCHRYSTYEIDLYLREASVQPQQLRVASSRR